MSDNPSINNKITILVNSCDAYEDLWIPFFTLLKKYWNPANVQILLNTETKSFSFEGLQIKCIHSADTSSYGARMLNALNSINSEYVVLLLDDFFLRKPVDNDKLLDIIRWMDNDKNIVYFNCDYNKAYIDFEVNKYPGYRRLPLGNDYVLSLQAAIWRTEILKQYLRPEVNPWEWEIFTNALTFKHPEHKFYSLLENSCGIFDYGHYKYGDIWGVYRGKWFIADVKQLFEKENICVDFSIRGEYNPNDVGNIVSKPTDRRSRYASIRRCLGLYELPKYFLFCQYCKIMRWINKPIEENYYKFLQNKARKHFLKIRR